MGRTEGQRTAVRQGQGGQGLGQAGTSVTLTFWPWAAAAVSTGPRPPPQCCRRGAGRAAASPGRAGCWDKAGATQSGAARRTAEYCVLGPPQTQTLFSSKARQREGAVHETVQRAEGERGPKQTLGRPLRTPVLTWCGTLCPDPVAPPTGRSSVFPMGPHMQTVGSTGWPPRAAPGYREGTGSEPRGRGWWLLLSPPKGKDKVKLELLPSCDPSLQSLVPFSQSS